MHALCYPLPLCTALWPPMQAALWVGIALHWAVQFTQCSLYETTTAAVHLLLWLKGHRPLIQLDTIQNTTLCSLHQDPTPNDRTLGSLTLGLWFKLRQEQPLSSCCHFLSVPTPRAGLGWEGGRQQTRCGAPLFCCCSYRRTQDGARAMCSWVSTVRVLDAYPLKHQLTNCSQNIISVLSKHEI